MIEHPLKSCWTILGFAIDCFEMGWKGKQILAHDRWYPKSQANRMDRFSLEATDSQRRCGIL
jgi:hypothetical protein